MKKTPAKKMAMGGPVLPAQARTGMGGGMGMGNAGGAMRGLDRAAAMSGRTMPAMKKGGTVKKPAMKKC